MTNRRAFIQRAALLGMTGAAAASGAWPDKAAAAGGVDPHSSKSPPRRTARSLRVLLLGATGNIGPHFVRATMERGHKVSVFVYSGDKNRSNLPVGVEVLPGDRNGDLKSLMNRDWDAVLDLATFGPLWVRTLGEALKGRVRHYTYISSQDAYRDADLHRKPTTEESVVWEYAGEIDPYSEEAARTFNRYTKPFCEGLPPRACMPAAVKQYGSLKVLCEREAERQFPGKALVLRPTYLVGPGDPQVRFTYWVVRLNKGGDVLAPGNPLQTVQFIDVRDVAEYAIRMAELGEAGVYNTTGPNKAMSMCEMLGGIRASFSSSVRLTWVTEPRMLRPEIYDESVPFWGGSEMFGRDILMDSSKAYAKGLGCRPLNSTALDTLGWYASLSAEEQSGIGFKSWQIKWDEIFRKERKIIETWNVHVSRLSATG